MTLPILLLTPSQASYAITGPADTTSIKLDGGRSRTRRNILNGCSTVNIGWTLDKVKYDYLWAFYRSSIAYGSLQFQINLILQNAELQLYTATFVPQSLQLTGVEAENYTCQAQLEVMPLADNPTLDASIIAAYTLYGPSSDLIMSLIDHAANVSLPAAL